MVCWNFCLQGNHKVSVYTSSSTNCSYLTTKSVKLNTIFLHLDSIYAPNPQWGAYSTLPYPVTVGTSPEIFSDHFWKDHSNPVFLDNGDMITNPYDIANTFNNCLYRWNYIKSIKYSQKQLSDYLLNERSSAVFLQPTDKEKIANIIPIFNLSFMTSVFSSVLKTAKVVPV